MKKHFNQNFHEGRNSPGKQNKIMKIPQKKSLEPENNKIKQQGEINLILRD